METGLNRQESFPFGAMPSPNIPDLVKIRQDLPLPDSRIGAFEPSLYCTIMRGTLTLLAYIMYNMLPKKQSNNNSKNKQSSIETK